MPRCWMNPPPITANRAVGDVRNLTWQRKPDERGSKCERERDLWATGPSIFYFSSELTRLADEIARPFRKAERERPTASGHCLFQNWLNATSRTSADQSARVSASPRLWACSAKRVPPWDFTYAPCRTEGGEVCPYPMAFRFVSLSLVLCFSSLFGSRQVGETSHGFWYCDPFLLMEHQDACRKVERGQRGAHHRNSSQMPRAVAESAADLSYLR